MSALWSNIVSDRRYGHYVDYGKLKSILKTYGLKKSQIARQLRNFKDEHYKHTQVQILLGEKELAVILAQGLALDDDEFVANFLQRLFDPSVT